MNKTMHCPWMLIAAALCSGNAGAQEQLLLTGARVLANNGDRFLVGHQVLIVGDRIAKVAKAPDVTYPADTRILDLSGLAVVPGLIDLHTHLLLHAYDETSWNDQVLKESLELRTIRAVTAAQATVSAGFTTIRELGTEGAAFADVALRDAIARGIVPGPRIFATTRAIVATGCYGPSGFDPRWAVPKASLTKISPCRARRSANSASLASSAA